MAETDLKAAPGGGGDDPLIERSIRMECLRLATGVVNVDIIALAKDMTDFVLGEPSPVAELEPKKRRKRKAISAERRAALMQQLVTARRVRQEKLAAKKAA